MKNNFSVLLGIKKVKIAEVSRETGISRTTLQTLYKENNKNPDTKTIMTLCRYFEVTPNDFFGIKEIKGKTKEVKEIV